MTTARPGLRERKKQATRRALSDAAERLALERGPDQVRVDDIAEAAGVSPRTYNNYFRSREHAIVSAVLAGREAGIATAVAARPSGHRLADVVTEVVVQQYTDASDQHPQLMVMITTRAPLREAFLESTVDVESPLSAAIAARLPDRAEDTARVLASSVAAAVRVALEGWIRPVAGEADPARGAAVSSLVVPVGALDDRLRAALSVLAPAFDAAEGIDPR